MRTRNTRQDPVTVQTGSHGRPGGSQVILAKHWVYMTSTGLHHQVVALLCQAQVCRDPGDQGAWQCDGYY